MTITAPERGAASPAGPAVGRVARVTGPVVDIEFPNDAIPEIYNALKTTIVIGKNSQEISETVGGANALADATAAK